jgi:hypothetical protein
MDLEEGWMQRNHVVKVDHGRYTYRCEACKQARACGDNPNWKPEHIMQWCCFASTAGPVQKMSPTPWPWLPAHTTQVL